MRNVFGTIHVDPSQGRLRRALSFVGPGYLVAVGYMDPGNWATSITGGAQFGYTLLSVVMLSSIMAIILQALAARLAIATGQDLAVASAVGVSRPAAMVLWLLAEIAIIATDIAEVVGTAIGLNLLFGLPLVPGILITALDVFLVLWLQKQGMRWVEAFVVSLLGVIFVSFTIQMVLAKPELAAVVHGFVPDVQVIHNPQLLYLALGIIGATVMPHNLYLHSGIVLTRKTGDDLIHKREALTFATLDSTAALLFAFAINASILILAAATFHASGRTNVGDLGHAHDMLAPLVGSLLAPKLFAIALLACGLNSTVTATMAGQIVMEGFTQIRLAAWLRRLITRIAAIIPSVWITMSHGASGAGLLLILSQVVLAFQLPFAIVPLVRITANRGRMGALAAPRWLTALSWVIAALIIALNVKLLSDLALGRGM
ncbi:MAG TPA: Nramp family divalent metal transporter [Aestuariivirga sp.]|nr:Nramp family divalent metal transporter [Aestuariivirga sp.]